MFFYNIYDILLYIMIILKELSYSSINSINTYMCYILIIIFIYVTSYNYSKIIEKINPKITYPPDFTSYLSKNINQIIDSLLATITKQIIQSETKVFLDSLNQKREMISSYANGTTETLNKNKKDIDIVNKTFEKLYSELNNTTIMLQKTIKTVENVQKSNIENVQKIYVTYKENISNYVNDLIIFLNDLNSQINFAYISPNLDTMIKPLKNMYNVIRTTLIDNFDFIKKFKPTFKISDIPKPTYTKNSAQDIQAKFIDSSKILSTTGYN